MCVGGVTAGPGSSYRADEGSSGQKADRGSQTEVSVYLSVCN